MLVEQRKQQITADRSEDCRPIRSLAVKRSMDRIKEMLDTEITETEKEMLKVINGHESIHHNYELVKSVDGVGLITAVELLVKTENFKITTARQYAAYAGTAPYEKIIGENGQGSTYPRLVIDGQRSCCTSAQKAPDCTTRRLNCITRDVL